MYKKVLAAITLLLLAAAYCLGISFVVGNSMHPAISQGSLIVFARQTSLFKPEIQRGDIVVFSKTNFGKKKIFIKRIIGLSQDSIVTLSDCSMTVNREPVTMSVIDHHHNLVEMGSKRFVVTRDLRSPVREFQVPKNKFLCFGDNMPLSIDSRNNSIGYVGQEQIVGKVLFSLKLR